MLPRLLILCFTLCLSGSSLVGQLSRPVLSTDDYIRLNNDETRLPEFKDSDAVLLMKISQLEVINRSRKKHKAAPLELDILASRVANMICREAALNNYVGHWNLAGEKPYHRYAFAGGIDHVSENASGQMTSGQFDNSERAIAERMIADHNSFMSEKKPNDGHKQTVIDKYHNYVGLGLYAGKQQFRYYELYIDRYYKFGELPSVLKPGEKFTLRVSPGDGRYINLVLAYYEKELRPMSPRAISSRPYYNDFTEKIALQIEPWKTNNYRKGDWYNIPLSFKKPGLYYIHLYSDTNPYKPGSRYSSRGKLQASGLVIRVRQAGRF